MLDLGLWQTFETTSNKTSCWLVSPFLQVPFSDSSSSMACTPGHRAGDVGAQTALLFPKASPPPHWHPAALLLLEETQLGYGYLCSLDHSRKCSFHHSVSGKRWGWADTPACRVIHAVSISKESLKNPYSLFKELLMVTGFSMPRDTGRNLWSMCAHTLEARGALSYHVARPPGTLTGVLESTYMEK